MGVGIRFSAGIPLQIRVVLNQQYIANVLLPRLLERHLGRNAEQHYDVLVRSAKENSLLLRWGAEDSRPWESAVGIFAVRPDCLLGKGSRTFSITTGPMTLSTTNAAAADPTTPDLTSLLSRSGNCSDMSNAAAGLWLVNIRARPSLSETIDSARRQSLAISFGVMLVLAMAIAILFVSGHRARELAARHEQFATGVSHELRTPLAVISSASENLADGVVQTADQIRQYGKMIHAHSEQLSAMIENALWFARKDARDALEVQDVDVEELVSTAAATSSRVLQEAGVALERDVGQGLRSIRANRVLLLHALQNLLTNVARHGSSGKWARVQAMREESKVVFTVEDRGDGIPSDEVAHVFEPFYRGKGAKETRLAGLGLGLTLVRNIVEAHGGKIELRSKHNRGTTIAFTVPICDSEELNPHPGASQPRYG
jgi:signal transduction histidine kinase